MFHSRLSPFRPARSERIVYSYSPDPKHVRCEGMRFYLFSSSRSARFALALAGLRASKRSTVSRGVGIARRRIQTSQIQVERLFVGRDTDAIAKRGAGRVRHGANT